MSPATRRWASARADAHKITKRSRNRRRSAQREVGSRPQRRARRPPPFASTWCGPEPNVRSRTSSLAHAASQIVALRRPREPRGVVAPAARGFTAAKRSRPCAAVAPNVKEDDSRRLRKLDGTLDGSLLDCGHLGRKVAGGRSLRAAGGKGSRRDGDRAHDRDRSRDRGGAHGEHRKPRTTCLATMDEWTKIIDNGKCGAPPRPTFLFCRPRAVAFRAGGAKGQREPSLGGRARAPAARARVEPDQARPSLNLPPHSSSPRPPPPPPGASPHRPTLRSSRQRAKGCLEAASSSHRRCLALSPVRVVRERRWSRIRTLSSLGVAFLLWICGDVVFAGAAEEAKVTQPTKSSFAASAIGACLTPSTATAPVASFVVLVRRRRRDQCQVKRRSSSGVAQHASVAPRVSVNCGCLIARMAMPEAFSPPSFLADAQPLSSPPLVHASFLLTPSLRCLFRPVLFLPCSFFAIVASSLGCRFKVSVVAALTCTANEKPPWPFVLAQNPRRRCGPP